MAPRISNRDVFPAPLGPTMAVSSPGIASQVTSCKITLDEGDELMFLASIFCGFFLAEKKELEIGSSIDGEGEAEEENLLQCICGR
ncbi:hypothetical protein V2J09_018956 [Rumex salicifolius]